MKTSIKTLTTICTVILSINLSAQRNHNGTNSSSTNSSSSNSQNNQIASNDSKGNRWGASVNVHFGGYPNMYPNYYGNNYGYGYSNHSSMRRAARNTIRKSAQIIGQALNFTDWNDIYSPWLAKAIRHQQYAKQLYFWGDYAGALNHAERASFLAWNTLNYFNNPYGYNQYNNGGYPNPYSDPNNPYYRQSNPNSSNNSNSEMTDDYGYRKGNSQSANENGSVKREAQIGNNSKIEKNQLDNSLPQSKLNDKELLKINAKELDVE